MCSVALSAQVRVSGTVIDAQKEPVIGASVLERGTGNGTVTDMDGQFTLEVASEKSVLEISYVGMKTQTVSVAGKPSIQVVLQEDQEVLDEVVVIGYGTQKRKDAVIAKELAHLDEYLTMLRERYGFTAQHVEYGPGLNAECFREDAEARDCALLDAAAEHIRAFGEKYPLTIEMGRFFAAPCGTFLTGVADAKCNLGVNYAVCDGGMHQVKYDGQLMGMQAPPLTLLRESADAAEPWMLCGSLCTTADVLVREAQLPPLRVGDVIALGRCGAYSVTEGVAVFLSRDMPRVALYRDGAFTLVRDRFATDVLNTCQTLEDRT